MQQEATARQPDNRTTVPVTPRERTFDCEDVTATGLWNARFCCFSCHIDHENYGIPLPSVVFSNGWGIEVCCQCRSQVGKHLARLQSDQSFLWWLRAADLEQLYGKAGRYAHLIGTSR